ncbi:MAG: hypothetical protein PHW10_04590 [Candidatus Peribacteraceae bacterium]|nr:hypothetical protein [Candidatus Peribacteraceae bacterium]
MKKICTFGLLLAIALLAAGFLWRMGEGTSSSVKEAVAQALGEKYNRPADSYVLDTDKNTGSFAKGSVRVEGEAGGGLWFASKTADGWALAFDGNGIMPCDIADGYDFPPFMVPSCLDAGNDNALRQR